MSEYVIWWLDQSAHELAEALGVERAKWPRYIKSEFYSLQGRCGRGRLWVAPRIKFNGIPWKDGDPAYDAVGDKGFNCGGIVIKRSDAHHILSWPGFVTDENMRPIQVSLAR